MRFLRNCWYLAAWAHEVEAAPLARKILNESIVLYRDGEGAVVALTNRCPHRFASFTSGRVIDGNLQCPYHGLRFGSDGRCVLNPHPPGSISEQLRVKAFEIRERDSAIWIWMGDRPADEATLPRLKYMSCPDQYRPVSGVIPLEANYALMNDNLLDLTHVPILHDGTVGNADMLENLTATVEREGDDVILKRVNVGIAAAPVYRQRYQAYEGMKVDKTQEMRWAAPSTLTLEITHHQTLQPDRHRTTAYVYHLITPETEMSSHYFWASCRDYDLDNDATDQQVYASVEKVLVGEDAAMVNEQQRVMGTPDFMSLGPVFIPTDGASLGARKILSKMIEDEERALA